MTEYMIGKGPGAGVQLEKEGPIMEDDNPADLDSILDRIAPERREAFLKSRARLIGARKATSGLTLTAILSRSRTHLNCARRRLSCTSKRPAPATLQF